MIERAVERSQDLFRSGYYCAESVLMAVAEDGDRDDGCIPQIATGHCSGIARTGGLCGAVSGAILAIGLALGRRSSEDSVEHCYAAVRELTTRFTERFGAQNCLMLTGCHLGTEEGQARFDAMRLCEACREYVGEATRLALEAIANHSD